VKLLIISLLLLSAFANAASVQCVNGRADEFPCSNVDFQAKIDLANSGLKAEGTDRPPAEPGNRIGSGVWGWTDPANGKEYAIMGLANKASFVDISEPSKPVHVADLPAHSVGSLWREVNVINNHAVIVSESHNHGLQILDLTQLSKLSRDRVHILEETAHYGYFGSSHTISVNEKTGYAYALGSDTCDAGAHVVDLRNPAQPKFVTCLDRQVFDPLPVKPPMKDLHKFFKMSEKNPLQFFTMDEVYTHDMICVVYNGPDEKYKGHEICVASNDNSLNIIDVTDKKNPKQVSVTVHPGAGYVHQGWFTEDQSYFLVNDEMDELLTNGNMKTYIYDFHSLDQPKFIAFHDHGYKSIDHNFYIKGNYVYQANYLAGLRILELTDLPNGKLTEVASFDTTPGVEGAVFGGVWNVYPYFKSGNVIMSHIEGGMLFIVKPNIAKSSL
jgi:hypothetical protein